ncbi:putative P-loop containing nucleoside triphosphate hydrolase [Rosa chinensis]|uniref:Sulfotransferase n=1 Tax=Rosa chinensis TaxID=74649 RepID=A0A2P6SGU5_ROSCH|nr:cytosolic sulfotransferase 15 [Rosa chinensis]PRQ57846.1 putative P-loop containing nucleoside triphosphate hydrolase [Rosa chinensis]
MTENQPADDEEKYLGNECKELLLSLPKKRGWRTLHLYQFQGFWWETQAIEAVISFQKHFQARDSDIVVATLPKSGTTWLKALTFAVVNRHRFAIKTHPLLTSNPHDLVPYFELHLYANNQLVPDLSKFPEPRLFGTHIPFPSLGTITESNCKIVYVCRNPFDTFISAWHFANKIKPQHQAPLSLDEAFDMYCQGMSPYGPFWDHVLEYWKESLKRPQNVLFFKYEDMKEDVVLHLKRLAEFLDYPFTMEEERNGVIEDIAKLCSFESLKALEVNKTGMIRMSKFENKVFFRKAEVGDWVNYLTPKMEERMSKVIEEKLGGSGLTFKVIPDVANPVQQN